ncbi:restriction endonuclease [Priestia sp. YIM B13486]|uniref:restriction endonuclease n=1 Tax=Priestia sp. YIM B13486 TaxID=3366304 RepID=UPI0036706DE3
MSRAFTSEDIDFSVLEKWDIFENMTKDLLISMGFHNIDWRDGGSDRGRDIQAELLVDYPMIGKKTEKWFFECKFYTGGVPVAQIVDKVGWATAEQADKLVIITSSHLTPDAKDYIEAVQKVVPTKIHYIDGPFLKELILRHDDIVEKYFLSSNQKLAKSTLEDYLGRGERVSFTKLTELCKGLKTDRYLNNENINIFTSYLSLDSDEEISYPFENLSCLIDDIIARNQAHKKNQTVLKEIKKEIKQKYKNNQELDRNIADTEFVIKLRTRFLPDGREVTFSYFFIEKSDKSLAFEILITSTSVKDWRINVIDRKNIKKIYKEVKSILSN